MDEREKRKSLLWLIILRLLIVTSLLISAVIIQFSTSVYLPLMYFYYLILVFYLLSALYLIFYFWGKHLTFQASLQIFFDLFLITALVYLSGGLRGSFYFLYLFEIVAASVVLSKRAAYLTAALSAIFFGLLVDGMYFGLIPYFGAAQEMNISLGLVINNIFIAWTAFFLVAFLTNYLITNLKKTREELHLTQKELEIKNRLSIAGEVSAQLAHEIRTPLAAISGAVQVLRDELELDAEEKQLMDIVVKESQRISQSIEQFLSLAFPGKKTFSPIELASVLKETLILLERGGELNGNYKLKGNFREVKVPYYGNVNQFKQIFWNIIKNSLRAMQGEGELSIDFIPTKKREIKIRFADTGRGMSEEEKNRIFEPFYSGFGDGRGIGLAVVRRIVDEYGGKIEFSSALNKGTEVVITFPGRR